MYACATCHKEFASDGSRRIHEAVGHDDVAGDQAPVSHAPAPARPPGEPPARSGTRTTAALLVPILVLAVAVLAVLGGVAFLRSVLDDDSPAMDELPPGVPAGYRIESPAGAGFSIAVPSEFVEIDDSPADDLFDLSAPAAADPAAADSSDSGGAESQDHLRLGDPDTGASLFVSSLQAPGITDSHISSGALSQVFGEEPIEGLHEDRVTLQGRPALRYIHSGAENGMAFNMAIFVVVRNETLWMFGYGAPGNDVLDTATTIANNFYVAAR